MGFFEVLTRVTELLQREGRISYRAIKREWHLDDASVEDLKAELIEVRQIAVDQDGKLLVWAGGATSTQRPAAASVRAPEHTPRLGWASAYMSNAFLVMGDQERAIESSQRALTIARGDFALQVTANYNLGQAYHIKGDFSKAIPVLERLLELCQMWQQPLWLPHTAAALGHVYALGERGAEALPLLEQAVEQAGTMGLMAHQSLRVTWLCEAHLLAGRADDATTIGFRAIELSRKHKERGYEAYALRLLGELAAQREPPEAERSANHYRQSLALAEELGMRPLVAHCHHGLGALYLKTGRREHARAELSAAIALYRSMEMTFWLPKAEAGLSQAG
jgi:tetratricopeptide (TPR) repeat protein